MAKHLTLEEFKKLYEEWQLSQLSIREFSLSIGINEDRFYYWRKKMIDEENAAPAFVPVQMQQQNGKLTICNLSNQHTPGATDGTCEIVYKNGVTLRVSSNLSLQTLRTLIQLFQ